jgi:hypothetical protein
MDLLPPLILHTKERGWKVNHTWIVVAWRQDDRIADGRMTTEDSIRKKTNAFRINETAFERKRR